MAAELNSGGDQVVQPKKEEVMEPKPVEKIVTAETEPWFKPKKGSVFPAKKKSVKTMMVQTIADSYLKMVQPQNALKSKKGSSVYPHHPPQAEKKQGSPQIGTTVSKINSGGVVVQAETEPEKLAQRESGMATWTRIKHRHNTNVIVIPARRKIGEENDF
ncbi:hypothetical protein O6P43_015109 [Quillaja saponaria]|uniref:Uncharacterized protein n=1 Tax=Quillaja saponaria TaxID=32244 RepID=A0AAD7PSQ1_QUISA|nr:hypothetical protein O6P43_015109 [Quillaja saponaria]